MSITTTPGLSGDEGFNGADAIKVLDGVIPIFFTDNFGREPLFIYTIAVFMKLFGSSIFAIRLASVFYGLLGIVFSYKLAKRLWNTDVALLSVGLISVSFWPVFISRIGLRAVTLPAVQAFTLYTLYRGIKTKSKPWLYISGIGLGLCPYTYIPGRIFPLIPLMWLCTILIFGSDKLRKNIVYLRYSIFICLLIALLVFLPLGLFIFRNSDMANQRIQELDWVLDRLKQGDIKPLINNLALLLKMFYIQGDSDVYYNIPFRPIFGISLGILFYLGILLSVLRLGKPENQLLLVWLVVMLLPSLLSTGGAIMRSVGALLPIYLLPSIALCDLLNWLPSNLVKYKRILFFGLLATLLASIGIRTKNDYFNVWAQLPRVRKIYNAGLSQIGQAMTSMRSLPGNPIVMVGCEYAADLCRDMVKLQTRYEGPIQWFKSSEALVIPYTEDELSDIFYFIADKFPLPDDIYKALSSAHLLQRFTAPDGTVESEVYRLSMQQSGNLISPQFILDGRFRDTMQLLGYDIPEQAERGSDLEFVIYWKVPQSFSRDFQDPPRWQVLLDDGMGNYWSETGGILPYSIWDWSPGEIIIHHISLPVPVDVPQGDWYPQVSIYRQYGGTLVYLNSNGEPSRRLTLEPVHIVGHPDSALTENVEKYGVNEALGLVSLTIADQVAAGSAVWTTIEWQTLNQMPEDYQLQFSLHDENCHTSAVYSSIHEVAADYPTSLWHAGEPVRVFYQLKIDPSLPNGEYMLSIDLIWVGDDGAQTSQQIRCQDIQISGRPHSYDLPQIQEYTNTVFSEGITLLGYDLTSQIGKFVKGESLEITLYWQSLGSFLEDYSVFVHIYSDSLKSEIVGQHDGPPCEGQCPTSSWLTQEILTDKHQISIPAETPPGQYPMGIGLYNTATFQRLVIPESPDNVLILTNIIIE